MYNIFNPAKALHALVNGIWDDPDLRAYGTIISIETDSEVLRNLIDKSTTE